MRNGYYVLDIPTKKTHKDVQLLTLYNEYLSNVFRPTRPDNETITTEQFNAYTSEVLDTMFDGYTITDAVGN